MPAFAFVQTTIGIINGTGATIDDSAIPSITVMWDANIQNSMGGDQSAAEFSYTGFFLTCPQGIDQANCLEGSCCAQDFFTVKFANVNGNVNECATAVATIPVAFNVTKQDRDNMLEAVLLEGVDTPIISIMAEVDPANCPLAPYLFAIVDGNRV
jgi:hypothetical protein